MGVDLHLALFHLLVVLIAARIAAESAERIRQPAVLIEIAVGVIIGPSVLRLIGHDDVLKVLAELGAIVLLFEVGLHTSLPELGRVGGDSLRVATIGVAVPLLLGYIAMRLMGVEGSTAIFVAGGITATSVGITARVFGDLRALATAEARTVLGAAVADDVGGLLILTVVVGIVSRGGISLGSVALIVGVALGFIAVSTFAGSLIAPPVFAKIVDRSKTEGTLMAFGIALALTFALLASAARLAPIVGAFIAGLALSGSPVRDELHRRTAPLGHFLIPIFFLMIGVETRLKVLADPAVLGIGAVVALIAVIGKMVAGAGVRKGRADRFLVGIAMVPRGEVGLIFAGLGLRTGLLDARFYAVLVLVVLITTFITPPWVRQRIHAIRKRAVSKSSAATSPPEGWLRIDRNDVDLTADPPGIFAPAVCLQAALLCATKDPGPRLLDWVSSIELDDVTWDEQMRQTFFALLREGNERSWRFLEVTGVIATLLPALGAAIQSRRRDPFELDPTMALRFPALEDLRAIAHRSSGREAEIWHGLQDRDLLLMAALASTAFENHPTPSEEAKRLSSWIGLDEPSIFKVGFLVAERELLPAAASRLDMANEENVLQLAAHIGTRQMAGFLYLLAVSRNSMEHWERDFLDELFDLIVEALGQVELTGAVATDLVEQRRDAALQTVGSQADVNPSRLDAAPRRYLLAQPPEAIALHLEMTAAPLHRNEVRLEVEPTGEPTGEPSGEPSGEKSNWLVHIAAHDRRGLLSAIAGALASNGLSIQEAFVSTWSTGISIDVFRVGGPSDPDWGAVRSSIADAIVVDPAGSADLVPIEGTITIDNAASPWYTIVDVRADDRIGLLSKVALAFTHADVEIHTATLDTKGGLAVDTFFVTGRSGGKLDDIDEASLRSAFGGRAGQKWRLPWARVKAGP